MGSQILILHFPRKFVYPWCVTEGPFALYPCYHFCRLYNPLTPSPCFARYHLTLSRRLNLKLPSLL